MTTFVHGSELREGVFVRAPAMVRDTEADRWVPLAEIWPDHPPVLFVRYWAWEDGESDLLGIDGRGSIDHNVLDYPNVWEIVDDPRAGLDPAGDPSIVLPTWPPGGDLPNPRDLMALAERAPRQTILAWLQWNDRNGHYLDAACASEQDGEILTRSEALALLADVVADWGDE